MALTREQLAQRISTEIQDGFVVDAFCFGCNAALLCIADAEYVLCPDCKTVSPGGEGPRGGGGLQHPRQEELYGLPGGVGLGLRADQHPDRQNNHHHHHRGMQHHHHHHHDSYY